MGVLSAIEPKEVFEFFEEICKIPHGSKNTKQISNWLVDFAKERNLEYVQDEFDNVIIKKAGTKGYENKEPLILQGHIDMVCEKVADLDKDMEKEGIDLVVDGDFVKAKGTTLGADNSIAVAMILALLNSEDLPHPPIEAVLTSDEEIGLIGATALDCSVLKGKRLINIDSEEEGIFTISCAGGNRTTCEIPVSYEEFEGKFYEITIDKLSGGHSGIDIDKGHANSSVLMGRILSCLAQKTELRIVSLKGGSKDNVITGKTQAKIALKSDDFLKETLKSLQDTFKNEYKIMDKNLEITFEQCEKCLTLDRVSTDKTIMFLTVAPFGIQEMSAGVAGLVQTSLNLGILNIENDKFIASFSLRSSIDSQKEMLVNKLYALTTYLGGKIEVSGDYPGWEYNPKSPLRDLLAEVYFDQYGKQPVFEAIHAGLECGLFAGKIKDLDCISLGPDLKDVHNVNEKMSISSVQRVWKMLVEALKRM